MQEGGKAVTVKDLLKVLYEKACTQKLWGLVRHTAGMLGKRVEDLAKAVTDLLVRQKQITVGMPPNNEYTITAPLPENELRQLIHQVCKFMLNFVKIFWHCQCGIASCRLLSSKEEMILMSLMRSVV